MVDTSTAYKTSVTSQGRRTAVRLRLPAVSDGITFTSTGANRVTQRSALPISESVPDIALLNGSWSLGSKRITSLQAPELGVVSQSLTNASGDISGFSITLAMSGEAFDFLGFKINFLNALGQYPVNFTVSIAYAVAPTHTYTLVGYTEDFWETDDLHQDATSIVIQVTKWSTPNSHIKIASISFGDDITLTDDEIISCNLIESMGYDSTTGLPALTNNTIECKFDKNALRGYTPAKKLKICTDIGVYTDDDTIEYIDCGCFYVDTYEQSDYDMVASIKGYDSLYGWGEDTWYCPKTNRDTLSRFRQLLGEEITFKGDYDRAYAKDSYYPSFVSKSETLGNLMLYNLAQVCSGKSGVDVIRISPSSAPVISISNEDIYDVKKIGDYSVKKINLSYGELQEEFYDDMPFIEDEIGEDGKRQISRYSPRIVLYYLQRILLDGQEVDYTEYYDCVEMETHGKQALTLEYGNAFYRYDTRTKSRTITGTVKKGLELDMHAEGAFYAPDFAADDLRLLDFVDNWSADVMPLLAATRYAYEINWRGNPALELGDKVRFEDKYGVWREGYIYDNQYTYEGYLRCKTIIRSGT